MTVLVPQAQLTCSPPLSNLKGGAHGNELCRMARAHYLDDRVVRSQLPW